MKQGKNKHFHLILLIPEEILIVSNYVAFKPVVTIISSNSVVIYYNVLFTEILKKNGLRRLPGRDISISSSEEELSSGILTELIEDLSNISWNGNHMFKSTEPILAKGREMGLRIPVCLDFRGR